MTIENTDVVETSVSEREGIAVHRKERPRNRLIRTWHVGRRVSQVAAFVILLVAWQIVSVAVHKGILVPSPLAVARQFALLGRTTILSDYVLSLRELGIGFGISIIGGVGFGVLLGSFESLNAIFSPYVSFLNATPTVALVPLIIVWFGVGAEARIIFIILLAVWSILINTIVGIQNVSRGYMELCAVYALSRRSRLLHVSLFSAAPYILAGVRVGLGRAIVGVIIGEMEMELAGVGGLLTNLGAQFNTAALIAMVTVTSVFGVALVGLLGMVEKRCFPWIRGTSGRAE